MENAKKSNVKAVLLLLDINVYVLQDRTTVKRITAYRLDRLTDAYTRQVITSVERSFIDGNDRTWNRNVCQAVTVG